MREYQDLSSFDLSWRWTDPTYAVLPADALAAIRPLTAASANELEERAVAVCTDAATETLDSTADEQATAEWLATLPIDDRTPVILSWNAETALETTWQVFKTFWSDFHYPSSDDLSVWCESQSWSLCIAHYETI